MASKTRGHRGHISISPELHAKLKAYCNYHDISISSLVEMVIDRQITIAELIESLKQLKP